MPYTVVFLWISAGAFGSGPTASQAAALGDFGAARGLTFRPLAADAKRAGLGAYDGALVDRLETELEQARTALSALEEEAASARLARTEAELLAHPHLPQAGFLMAECLALRAQLVRRHGGVTAEQLEASRAALEGPRAPAFGEGDSSASALLPAVRLQVRGPSAIDELEIDAQRVAPGATVELGPGLHHVRVFRSDRAIFATFVRVQPGQRELNLPVPALTPCSPDDLDGAAPAAPPAREIACQSWALVRGEGSGVGVALCRGGHCGPFVHWQRRADSPFMPAAPARSALPSWATFAIVGVATAAVTGLALWQSGALQRGDASTTRFRYDGVDTQGLRF